MHPKWMSIFWTASGSHKMKALSAVGGNVHSLQDSRNDDDALRSGGEDLGEVFAFDAADAENGKRGVAVDLGYVGRADRRVVRLGGSRKKRAKADVVGLLSKSGAGLRGTVGGEADELAGADEAAGFGDGLVVLTDMHAVRTCGADEFGVVVEDEGNSRLAAERGEDLGERENFGGGEFFGAKLEDLDATSEHGRNRDVYLQKYDLVMVPSSGVADVNKWMDQYIRQNIPFRPRDVDIN